MFFYSLSQLVGAVYSINGGSCFGSQISCRCNSSNLLHLRFQIVQPRNDTLGRLSYRQVVILAILAILAILDGAGA